MGAPGSGDGPSPGPAKIDPKTVGKMLDWADKRDGKHPLGPNSGPAKMDPKNVDKILDWGDKAENVLDVLVPYVRTTGTQFLDQWLTQMNSARTDATPPAEESKDVWFIALAGNLLWAASCFVPGAGVIKGAADGMSGLGKIMYATMGHAGALVGAGAFQRSQVDSSGVPTGKDLVPAALNAKRIELGKAFERNIDSWVSKLLVKPGFHAGDYRDKGRNKYLEAVDQVLWSSLFPSFGFQDFNEIYTKGLNAINGALADFNRQYKQWQERERNFATSRSSDKYGINMAIYPVQIQYFEEHYPFLPKLKFPGMD